MNSNHVIVLGLWIMQLTSIIYITFLLIKCCGLTYVGSLKIDKGNGNSSNRSPCVTIYHHNTNFIAYLATKKLADVSKQLSCKINIKVYRNKMRAGERVWKHNNPRNAIQLYILMSISSFVLLFLEF